MPPPVAPARPRPLFSQPAAASVRRPTFEPLKPHFQAVRASGLRPLREERGAGEDADARSCGSGGSREPLGDRLRDSLSHTSSGAPSRAKGRAFGGSFDGGGASQRSLQRDAPPPGRQGSASFDAAGLFADDPFVPEPVGGASAKPAKTKRASVAEMMGRKPKPALPEASQGGGTSVPGSGGNSPSSSTNGSFDDGAKLKPLGSERQKVTDVVLAELAPTRKGAMQLVGAQSPACMQRAKLANRRWCAHSLASHVRLS
jgi:hypothetical protein